MPEKEYIEREAIAKHIDQSFGEVSTPLVVREIRNFPTADVAEVVRCKDCTHRYVPARCALWVGNENGKDIFLERGDDFSCKYGEMRDTDDTK